MKKAHEREQNDEQDVSSGDDVLKVNVEASVSLPPPGPTAGSNPKPTPQNPPSSTVAHCAAG